MTHVMAKGANISLTAAAVRAVLRWSAAPGSPDVDASALLVGADGKVRSDADFVFYNQPRHPSGVVRHLPKQRTANGGRVSDAVEVDLAKLPPEVDRVVVAGSAEGGSFPAVTDLRVLLHDVAAAEGAEAIAEFSVTDTGDVSALVAAELYRRGGVWKFRAVGQGYASGLIGLATDFGITVEDEAAAAPERSEAEPEPAPAAPARPDPREEPGTYTLAPAVPMPTTPPPPPPAAPPVPPQPQAQPGYGYPQAPAPTYGYPQPQPTGYGYPQAPQAPQPQGYGYPPQQQYPTGYGYPQQPAQPPVAPPPPAQPPQQQQPEQTPFALPPQGPQFQPR